LLRIFDREQAAAVIFIRPLRTVTGTVVVLVAALVWLDNVGFNIGTLLTGLGIGGVAVALAAQKSLEDVFGAITLYSGRPVRVGDFCRFGNQKGTIEEIGLRWTRVRTLDDSVVNVSNSVFSKENLENYAERRKIWFHPRLRLRYDTTPEQVRFILVESRKLLYSHPRVLEEDARVRFVGLGEYSLDLDVFAYMNTNVYSESLEISEDLTLQLMEIVNRAGAVFALSSQAYIEPGIARDAERATAAEGRVGEMRNRNELYLPSFPSETISELRGSLPYPPAGAPA
jgi:MscS family membrane protein